jgi:hypothetical protein
VVRHRFDAAIVEALLAAAWWDLPHAEVTRLVPLLQSGNAAGLIAAAGAVAGERGIA